MTITGLPILGILVSCLIFMLVAGLLIFLVLIWPALIRAKYGQGTPEINNENQT